MRANDVEREVLNYIREKENMGALLITGKWGCGKTYLIKKIAERINGSKVPIASIGIVSLFGLNSVGDIKRRVIEEYSIFYLGASMKTVADFSKRASKLVKDVSELADSATANIQPANLVAKGLSKASSYDIFSFIDVHNTLGKEGKTRPFVIVFDDLERCTSIPIEDRLGVLNEYLENKKIKVIILADETKIDDEKKYNDFKEKLIARTINLSKSDDDIINTIIKTYKTNQKKYKTFLSKNKRSIIIAFKQSGYNNLRTLKACVYDFERVFNVWVKSGLPPVDMPNQFYRFCAIECETRAGNYRKLINSDYPYGIKATLSQTEKQDIEAIRRMRDQSNDPTKIISFNDQVLLKQKDADKRVESKYAPDTFRSFFPALSKWIVDGEWEESEFIDELEARYKTPILSPEDRFVRVPFWELQQDDIDNGLPVSLEKANSGDLSCDDLISFFNNVHVLKKHNAIPENVQIDYSVIEQGFINRMQKIKDNEIIEPARTTFTDKENIDEEAVPIYKKIEGLRSKINAWGNRTELIKWLENSENNNTAPHGMQLDEFDDTLYSLSVDKFKTETNGGKRELINVLETLGLTLYSDEDNLEHSKENFKKMSADIKSYCETCEDAITRILGELFVEKIKGTITTWQKELTKRREGGFLS